MRHILIIILLLLTFTTIEAQVASTDTNHTIQVLQQGQIKTVGKVRNLSIVDNRLFFYNADVLFSAPIEKEGLGRASADEQMHFIDEKMEYVTKCPVTGDYYFTKTNHKGVSLLYRLHFDANKNGKPVISRVKLGKFGSTVEHPTLSSNGDIMVFTSTDFYGFGGYDLWYTQRIDGQWQEPRNMGRRINTTGDEIAPYIVGDMLYYATNSDFSSTGHDIYCTRLIATSNQSGDTVFTFPIGRSTVQRLPNPISSMFNDYEIVMHPTTQTIIFASNRDEMGSDQLYVTQNRVDCMMLEGDVENATTGERLPDVRIDVALASKKNNIIFSQRSGQQGYYRLYLQPEENYLITFSTTNFLSNTIEVNTQRTETEDLQQIVNYPILLLTFDTVSSYVYQGVNLFGSEVGTDLIEEGQQTLESVARFLQENPHRAVEITAVYSEQDNRNYNRLICTSRLESVRAFLEKQQVLANNITLNTPQTHQMLVRGTDIESNAIIFKFK